MVHLPIGLKSHTRPGDNADMEPVTLTFWQRLHETLADGFFWLSPEEKIVRAALSNRVEDMVALIQQHQWDVNAPLTTFPEKPAPGSWERHHGGWRLIHIAASRGFLEAAERLVELGAEVDIRTDWGITPAMHASYKPSSVLVDFLVSEGADPQLRIPSTSTFWDDYVGPTVLENLNSQQGREHEPGEYARLRGLRLDRLLEPAEEALAPRPRL